MSRKLFLLFACALLLPGCESSGLQKGVKTDVTLSGYVAKSKTANCYGFLELHDISVSGKNLLQKIKLFEPIKTRHIMKMEVRQGKKSDFKVFLGPLPSKPLDFAEAQIRNAMAYIYLTCGFVHVSGEGPRVRTGWVDAGADGSTIVVVIAEDETPPVHRVFFLAGTGAFANTETDHTTDWNTTNTYVDVTEDGVIHGPFPIAPTFSTFITELDAIVES